MGFGQVIQNTTTSSMYNEMTIININMPDSELLSTVLNSLPGKGYYSY